MRHHITALLFTVALEYAAAKDASATTKNATLIVPPASDGKSPMTANNATTNTPTNSTSTVNDTAAAPESSLEPKAECPGAAGPALNTTLRAELAGKVFDYKSMLHDIDTDENGFVDDDEEEAWRKKNARNDSGFFTSGFFNMADRDGNDRVSLAEISTFMDSVLNETYTGCSGTCNAVNATLTKCKIYNATAVDEDKKLNDLALFTQTACHLNSPDHDAFAECVLDEKHVNDCDEVKRCFKKVRKCIFGHCSLATIAVQLDDLKKDSNSTSIVATDRTSIQHQKVKNVAIDIVKTLAVVLAFPFLIVFGLSFVPAVLNAAIFATLLTADISLTMVHVWLLRLFLLSPLAALFLKKKPQVVLHGPGK